MSNLSSKRRKWLGLATVAVSTALHDKDLLLATLGEIGDGLPVVELEEVILQTLLFAGFPRTIEALGVLRDVYPQTSVGVQVQVLGRDQGVATCRSIYGSRYERLLAAMDRLHPDLTDWILEDGYGRVLSRSGLDLHSRELCVLAVLMATHMDRQLLAHVRGGINLGIAPDDIVWFTNSLIPIIPAEFHRMAVETVNKGIENNSRP